MTNRLLSINSVRHSLAQSPYLLLRPLIIIGVLFLSGAIVFAFPSDLIIVVPGLVIGIGAVLLMMRWPLLSLLAIFGTLMVPFDGPSGLNATMAILPLLILLWLLDSLAHRRKITLLSSSTFWPLLALMIVAALAFGVGQMPWYTFAQPAPMGAQLGGLAIYILSAAAFLLIAHYARDLRRLKWMVWAFLAVGGLYVAGQLIPGLGKIANTVFNPSAVGSLFWTWLAALSFSQAAFNQKLHPGWRVIIGILFVTILYMGLFRFRTWNSGWVPPLVAVVGTLLIAKPRPGLLAILAGTIAALIKFKDLVSLVMVGDNEYSLSTRLDAWAIVWEIAKVNPILGLGPANYRWYTPLFPIRGWAIQFNSHSQYLDLIAQTGILGLICFLWFFIAVAWVGWRLRERVPAGFARAYVYGTVGGVAGTLAAAAFGDWVLPFFYNVGLSGFRASVLSWLFLGGLIALEQIYTGRPKPV